MRKVDIYIEVTTDNYEKLELFNDEEIQINSSIQNIQDLAKVYTDFTQSFTIPASPHNNRLFEHFYQTDVDAENNPNIRRNAFIEIGTIPFRSGKMSIESSNVVKGRVESYSVTFYGDLTSLKDKFGDDTLKDLDLRSYGHAYSGTEVSNRVHVNANYNIRYPLISANRIWSYGDGTSTDINTSAGAILYTELFPALRVKKIIEAIQTKYGVTFDSNFLNQKLFKDLFLLLKNDKELEVLSDTKDVTFVPDGGVDFKNIIRFFSTYLRLQDLRFINLYANLFLPEGVVLYFDTYIDGKLMKTTKVNDTGLFPIFSYTALIGKKKLELKVRANTTATISISYYLEYTYSNSPASSPVSNAGGTISFVGSQLDPTIYAPKISVADFLSGIFKMFNLTCYAKSLNTFQVEPLDDWYTKGAVIDITKYVDTDEITIERHKLYKAINFDYEKSESFINKQYFNEATNATREFGCLGESFSYYDGGEYKVELPFENVYFTKENTENAAEPPRAFLLNESTSTESYDNKPILLYLDYEKTGMSYYFADGTSTSLKTSYFPLTNQLTYNNALYSNHFSVEGSAFDGTQIDNSLYQMYYSPYLQNLFNRKNRITNVKALFPISLLTSLKLNDRLIIRDKRYIINEMKVNLTTGDVDLALINDFRPVANVNIPQQSALESVVEVPLFPNGFETFSYQTLDPILGLISQETSTDEDTLINITIPENTTGLPIEWPITRDGEPYATIYQDA